MMTVAVGAERTGAQAMRPVDAATLGDSRLTLHQRAAAAVAAICLVLVASLAGGQVWAQEEASANAQLPVQGDIRLGMSADFSASARALGIELYRGAMAYLLPLNKAGGINGHQVVIMAYDDQYNPDQAIRN